MSQLNQKEYERYIQKWEEGHNKLIKSEKCKNIFLEILPRWEKAQYKGKINWNKCNNYKVNFIYENIKGQIEIVDYNQYKQKLTINYNNENFDIKTNDFIKCAIGRILGKISIDFKYKIGMRLQDDKRDIIIIDRKYIEDKNGRKRKYYKYKCIICTYDCKSYYSTKDKEYKSEYWIEEGNLKNNGCLCCANKIVVENINSIYTTDKWMIPYIGEECAKTHTHGSHNKVKITCPDCGRVGEKQLNINNLYANHSFNCSCSDKIPYPEKLIYSVLKQLKVDFRTQLNKTTFKWCDKYKYDFYFKLNNEEYIIETHGRQHYEDAWDELEKTQLNDKLKKELTISNGIKEENYIVIDCRYSNLEWIRGNDNGISNSRLNELFVLSSIDWLKAEEFTCNNLIKIACEYKNNNTDLTCNDIGNIMRYNRSTIRVWLKKGNLFNWCKYIANNELARSHFKNSDRNKLCHSKTVEIFKNGISLGIFPSCAELERQSEKLFGIKLLQGAISYVCLEKSPQYKGFTFKYNG